jgi:hypothetical protein
MQGGDVEHHGHRQSANWQRGACEPTVATVSASSDTRPRRPRRTYLDFQVVVTTDATSMHFIVGIVSIATRFILHESKAVISFSVQIQNGIKKLFSRRKRLTGAKTQFLELGYHSEQGDHTC